MLSQARRERALGRILPSGRRCWYDGLCHNLHHVGELSGCGFHVVVSPACLPPAWSVHVRRELADEEFGRSADAWLEHDMSTQPMSPNVCSFREEHRMEMDVIAGKDHSMSWPVSQGSNRRITFPRLLQGVLTWPMLEHLTHLSQTCPRPPSRGESQAHKHITVIVNCKHGAGELHSRVPRGPEPAGPSRP